MPKYLEFENGNKFDQNEEELRKVKKKLLFYKVLTVPVLTTLILSGILSGIVLYLTLMRHNELGPRLRATMDCLDELQMIQELTSERFTELKEIMLSTNDELNSAANLLQNCSTLTLETYSLDGHLLNERQLLFISPSKKISLITSLFL